MINGKPFRCRICNHLMKDDEIYKHFSYCNPFSWEQQGHWEFDKDTNEMYLCCGGYKMGGVDKTFYKEKPVGNPLLKMIEEQFEEMK